MMNRVKFHWAIVLIAMTLSFCMAREGCAYSINPANNHRYKIFTGSFTWDEARAYASNEGYYLATITNQAEQNFIQDLLFGYNGEFWLGAYQDHNEKDPRASWRWLTGEKWDFTNWQPNEANDWREIQEMHLGIWSNFGWRWNDEHGRSNIAGFVAEMDDSFSKASTPAPVPEPATMLMFGTGLIGLAGIGRKKLIKK